MVPRPGDRAMADPAPLDFLEKRRILHARGMERRRASVSTRLLDEGRLAEAMEYIEKERDHALLDRVRRDAVTAGDAFSLARVAQLLKIAPEPSEWRDLARYAESKERWFDCVNALEKAGDLEKAEEVRAARCPGFRPFRPAGK